MGGEPQNNNICKAPGYHFLTRPGNQKEASPDKNRQAVRAYKDYLESNAPKLWFQGHIHESFELKCKTTTVCSVYRSLDYSLEGR